MLSVGRACPPHTAINTAPLSNSTPPLWRTCQQRSLIDFKVQIGNHKKSILGGAVNQHFYAVESVTQMRVAMLETYLHYIDMPQSSLVKQISFLELLK